MSEDIYKALYSLIPEDEVEAVRAYVDGEITPVLHAKKIHAHSQGGGTHWFVCGHCEKPVDGDDEYCRHCGAKLDGEV